jgi:Flp pilus assembly protein TadG
VLLLLGAVDVGQFTNVHQKVSDASRKGARVAARYSATSTSQVREAVLDYLEESTPGTSASTLAAATVVTVTNADGSAIPGGDLRTIPTGSKVRVKVSLQFAPVRIVRIIAGLDGSNVEATSTMRRE